MTDVERRPNVKETARIAAVALASSKLSRSLPVREDYSAFGSMEYFYEVSNVVVLYLASHDKEWFFDCHDKRCKPMKRRGKVYAWSRKDCGCCQAEDNGYEPQNPKACKMCVDAFQLSVVSMFMKEVMYTYQETQPRWWRVFDAAYKAERKAQWKQSSQQEDSSSNASSKKTNDGYKPQQKWKQGWWKQGRWSSSSSSHKWSSGPWEWDGAQQGWSSQSQQWSAADWPDESIEDEKLAIADADDEPLKAAGADEEGTKLDEFQ